MFERIRDALIQIRNALDFVPDWVAALIILGLVAALALGLHYVTTHLLGRVLKNRPYTTSVLDSIQGPTRLALVVLAFSIALPIAPLAPEPKAFLLRLLLVTVIGLTGWAVMIALNTAASLYLRRFRIDTADNLAARKHLTQIRILLRTADVLIIIITASVALMTFDAVRQYGVSLFASAGVAGLVVGLAARPVLSNLLAGVQLAVTQPIRIDDAVLIENEWGQIEDITATYVVVRLWDLRRLVVPLTYFIEKPFQNWTREGSDIIGSVILSVEYATPVARVREKAKEIAEQSHFWNRKLLRVEVFDSKENVMELRILVSANSAKSAWDLRCEMREKLIEFLLQDYPAAFPRRPPPAEPADVSKPAELADTSKPAEPADTSKSAEPADTSKSAEPADTSEQAPRKLASS
jgi:small-conductance mechanosensitive channel